MTRTRESFLSGDLCKRYAERGLAINALAKLLRDYTQDYQNHSTLCGVWAKGATAADCNCEIAAALAEAERVGNSKGAA